MLQEIAKTCIRSFIGATSGETVPVLRGPLRGRRMLRQHGLPHLSMLFGTYEKVFSDAFSQRLPDGDVIYDIGANVGYFSLLAAQKCRQGGTVHAFEPVPELVADLEAMMDVNKLDGQVTAHTVALSDTNGSVRFYTPASAETGVIATVADDRKLSDESCMEVATVTMDSFVFEQGHQPPDVVKLDVEGAEACVLKGAQRVLSEHAPIVLAEVHGAIAAGDVWDVMAPLSYELALLTPEGDVPIRDRDAWVNLFGGSRWRIHHCVLTPARALAEVA